MSGFGAVVATIPEARRGKRNGNSKLKQVWHKLNTKQCGLYIAIIGLLVAMLSQFVETIKASMENKDAQTKYAAQISVATNSLAKLESQSLQMQQQLAYLNHMAGEFDTLNIEATYELISTNPDMLIFAKRVSEVAHHIPLDIQSDHSNVISATFQIGACSLVGKDETTANPSREEIVHTDRWSQNIVGYMSSTLSSSNSSAITNALHATLLSQLVHGGSGEPTSYEEVFSSDWLASVLPNNHLTELADFVRLPMLGIRIVSKQTTDLMPTDADFSTPPNYQPIQPTIGYDPVLNGVIIKWSINYPSSQWRQTVRMGSIRDLDAATLCFYLANTPDFLTNDFKPLSLKLNFGKTTLTVCNFKLQSYEDVAINFSALYIANIISQTTSNLPATVLAHFHPANIISQTTSILPVAVHTYLPVEINLPVESNRVAVFKTVLPPPSYKPIEEIKTSPH